MIDTGVSVIIPAHNEAQVLGKIIDEISALYPDFEIIVINDGSTDNTVSVAKEAGAIVYSHPYNIGNGAAIKSGIRIASGEILVFMDGDGQHNPEDIVKMLEYLPDYDMVVGARSKGNQVSLFRGFGNRVLNRLAGYVAKFSIKDLTSGFRAVKAEIAHNLLYLLPNTYSYPTTMTLGVLRSGKSLKYIPISINKRENGTSDISPFRDGIRFFMIITKICALYSPFRIFLPVSFFIFLIGLSYYIYTYFTSARFTNMSALLFTTSIIVFLMGLISEQISQMRFERSEGNRID
ncbi:MAG: glycosyltransferase family 2 protein [Deltaproteobacteria bacterium]|nr:glycosyltransferase family 2 protein [Deltaproteobacteria bacterium]